jgi:hypothetical protein
MFSKRHRAAWILFGCMFSVEMFPCTIEVFPGAKKARRHATAVFVGKVINVRSLSNGYAITFAVVKSWKGIKEKEVSIEGDQGIICSSVKFEDGRAYLVYAYDRGGGLLGAAESPGYSKRIEDASKDIVDLGRPRITFGN